MKIYNAILIVCLAVCGCAAFSKGEKVRVIDKFSDKLATLIKNHDSAGFANCFPREGDQWQNVNTGNASELPINEAAFKINQADALKQFDLSINKIEKALDCKISDIQLSQVDYLIDETQVFERYGVLKFDVTLKLVNGRNQVEVWLQGCGLSMRGVLFASDLVVIQK